MLVISVVIFGIIQASRQPAAVVEPSTPVPTETSGALVVREDSRLLNDVPDATVTFVEFLDFECEACAAVFPAIEQLRQTYGDRVSFVIRYFPLPSHFNSERAARAVEAAAQQGELEAMYTKMYQTQTEWGEQQIPKDDLFRQYAQELGLDLEQWTPRTTLRPRSSSSATTFNDGVARRDLYANLLPQWRVDQS